MPAWVMAIITGACSGLGAALMQAAAKLFTWIPTAAQSRRDTIYSASHKLINTALSSNFDANEYAKQAQALSDTIRAAANTAT